MEKAPCVCEDGYEEYPWVTVVVANLVMILWVGLGTAACYFLNHVVAWVFLAFALLMVFVVLRRLVCVSCYYYGKRCATGWGKLSALMFKQGRLEELKASASSLLPPHTAS